MVALGRRPKLLSKPIKRIVVSKRTESSATRRGGLPREPRALRSPLFPDLRRFDLSRFFCSFLDVRKSTVESTVLSGVDPKFILFCAETAHATASRRLYCH